MDIKKKCQSHLWLLTGTSEGYDFAKSLIKEGWKITVSVVSQRASIPYEKLSLENIFVGPLQTKDDIRSVILNARNNLKEFHCVVDLTHPFAVNVTASISGICKELDQPFIRYERSNNKSNALLIKSLNDLANYDLENKSILLALGVKKLNEAISIVENSGAKAFSRVLANPESIKKTLSSSIDYENVAILNPSLSGNGQIEKALIRKWAIDGVVCRQSGGVTENLWQGICLSMGIKLWMLKRPSLIEGIDSIDTYEKLSHRLKSINLK